MQTLGGVRGFLMVSSLPFPPRLLPLLLRLLQQLIPSCGRASAIRGPSAGRRRRENAGGGCPSPAEGCWPEERGRLGQETAGGGSVFPPQLLPARGSGGAEGRVALGGGAAAPPKRCTLLS